MCDPWDIEDEDSILEGGKSPSISTTIQSILPTVFRFDSEFLLEKPLKLFYKCVRKMCKEQKDTPVEQYSPKLCYVSHASRKYYLLDFFF